MHSDTRKFNIIAGAFILASLLLVLLFPSPVQANRMYHRSNPAQYMAADDFSGVEEELVSDAEARARDLFGSDKRVIGDYVSQLVGVYENCRDIDVLVIFNAGGFGWDSVTDSDGWATIMEGITGQLFSMGYEPLVLDYKRSEMSLGGVLSEALAFWGFYPLKSEELASRIDFLTAHLPDLKVIITGESNGASIVEETIRRLAGNQQVFAIQTGPTVFTRCIEHERSLVLRHNGSIPDSFSQGDVFTIMRSNLEAVLGIYQEQPGDILFYIGAPGHYYTWEFTGLRQEILQFLRSNF